MVARLQQKRLKSYDGTELCYHIGGKGPAVVLANGLGGPLPAYRYIVDQLIGDYTILSWDYRGLFGSKQPANPTDLSVAHQVRDMKFLMDAEEIDQAVILGWSMGVQVCCEFYNQQNTQVAGLILLCGVAGSPFKTLPGGGLLERIAPTLMNLGKCTARPLGAVGQALMRWKGFVPMMQRAGVIAPELDQELFGDIAQEFAAMDMAIYCETLKQLGQHDAYDKLPNIEVPTLLIAGDKDLMTPEVAAKRMHKSIAGSHLVVIEGGTHYTPVEFPNQVGIEIDTFLRRVDGWKPAACRPSLS